jgi:hypothetical protein
MKTKKGLFFFVYFNIICLSIINCETLQDYVNKLSTYSEVAGPIVYRGAQKSEQWKIYEVIKEVYDTKEIVNEFIKSKSIVVKIYLYWALRDKKYEKIESIKNEMLKYENMEIQYVPYGCIITNKKIIEIINDRLEIYLENNQKNDINNSKDNPLLD